ncbi:copper transporter [Phlegmacium glaucopus]|nr:copper transporter [Phlegmacium glaucopus]
MAIYVFLLLLATFLVPNAHASMNGMDMSMDGAMALSSGNMRFFLHFTPGDPLWFQGWVPQSGGAMVGACIGLFMLALVDRWLAAIRAMGEVVWRKQAEMAYINAQNAASNSKLQASKSKVSLPRPTVARTITLRTIPPFIPAHDIIRGILHAGQAALTFVFMLTVMTYQVSFIISIVVGLGVGEAVFGRYISSSNSFH